MKWLKKLWERRGPEAKPTPSDEARKEALRIEVLEERVVPSILWDD